MDTQVLKFQYRLMVCVCNGQSLHWLQTPPFETNVQSWKFYARQRYRKYNGPTANETKLTKKHVTSQICASNTKRLLTMHTVAAGIDEDGNLEV
jgi:hypothetical protein